MRALLFCLPRHRDESYSGDVLAHDPRLGPRDHHQVLLEAADGDDQPPADLELIDERLGDVHRGGSDEDPIEGRRLGPASVAIPRTDLDVGIAEGGKALLGLTGELLDDLDRINLAA